MSKAEVLIIKIGEVAQLTFADGSHALGAEGNDVGLKAHHGGPDKALFFMSDVSFPALNALLGENFTYDNTAIYGENFVVSGFNEDSVCVGDRFKIGSVLLEVSQPRKPCERLSKNTENENTQKIVHQSGWTGWYVRVIETGEIHKGDEIILQQRPYPQFTIRYLNRLLSDKPSMAELEQALAIEELAPAFKRSLNSKLMKLQEKQS